MTGNATMLDRLAIFRNADTSNTSQNEETRRGISLFAAVLPKSPSKESLLKKIDPVVMSLNTTKKAA
jgi:hypothetical protein